MLKSLLLFSASFSSTILVLCTDAKANVSDCSSTLREVRSQISQRHGVRVLAVNEYSLEIAGYVNPGYESTRSRNTSYSFTFDYSSEALNFQNSPQTARSYAQRIADSCPSIAIVSFYLERADGIPPRFALNRAGQMQQLQCVGMDAARRLMPWGYMVCS